MPVTPTASTVLSPAWTPATSNPATRSTTNQSPDMTLSPPPRAEVFLVQNRLNPISTRATLELTDDNLRCTVQEYSKWVEKALGISDLRSRLQAGEAVAAFDFRRDQLKIRWLKQFLNAGFSVSEGGCTVGWYPSFIRLESWHSWRWWTAGTSTTNGGGLFLRPDPRVPNPTTTPQHRVHCCLVIIEHALLPVRALDVAPVLGSRRRPGH